MNTNKFLISILIRSYNEEIWIENTINMILKQTIKNIEIIVVDSESNDNTINIANQYTENVFTIPKAKFTYGYSLNYGISKCQGEFVVSLSAHAVPKNQYWLENLLKSFKQSKNIVAVFSRQEPWPDCNPVERKVYLNAYPLESRMITSAAPFMSNVSCLFNNNYLKQYPFNEKLSYAEDIFWAKNQLNNNKSIFYCANSIVYHSHNENIKQVYYRRINEYSALYQNLNIIKYKSKFILTLRLIKHLYISIKTIAIDVIKKNIQIKYIPKSFAWKIGSVFAEYTVAKKELKIDE